MRIDFLADYPQYIEVLAPALVEHWAYLFPKDTVFDRRAKLIEHLNRADLPIAWVAHQGGRVFGTAALRVHDLHDHSDLTPWLGGVFVMPAFRTRGIGSALCSAVEQFAIGKGIRTLYLFTVDQQSLYERLGWRVLERTAWQGLPSVIMTKDMSRAGSLSTV